MEAVLAPTVTRRTILSLNSILMKFDSALCSLRGINAIEQALRSPTLVPLGLWRMSGTPRLRVVHSFSRSEAGNCLRLVIITDLPGPLKLALQGADSWPLCGVGLEDLLR